MWVRLIAALWTLHCAAMTTCRKGLATVPDNELGIAINTKQTMERKEVPPLKWKIINGFKC